MLLPANPFPLASRINSGHCCARPTGSRHVVYLPSPDWSSPSRSYIQPRGRAHHSTTPQSRDRRGQLKFEARKTTLSAPSFAPKTQPSGANRVIVHIQILLPPISAPLFWENNVC